MQLSASILGVSELVVLLDMISMLGTGQYECTIDKVLEHGPQVMQIADTSVWLELISECETPRNVDAAFCRSP